MEGMKDSGTSHLGKIPVEWNVRPFKYCVNICNGREYADIEVEEGGYPVIGSGGEFARASKFCYQGESVLLGRKGTIDKPMYINDAFWCVDTMFYTQIKPNMCARFLYYCALNFRFDYYMTSTALPSMTQSDLGAEKICVPEKSEQQAIADFLDDKCSQIDGIIADIEMQIEILKSYKKSLITETVTKGLDKNVKMKDSGVEWIGQIPEHWDVNEIKYMSILKGRIGWQGLTSDEYQDEGAFLITGVNFNNGGIDWESCEHIPMKRWEEAKDIQIEDGDLLITKDGTIGKVAVVSGKPGETSLNSGVMRIKTHEGYNRKYLYWVLQSDVFWNWFNLKNAGNSTIQHLYR